MSVVVESSSFIAQEVQPLWAQVGALTSTSRTVTPPMIAERETQESLQSNLFWLKGYLVDLLVVVRNAENFGRQFLWE